MHLLYNSTRTVCAKHATKHLLLNSMIKVAINNSESGINALGNMRRNANFKNN